MSDDIKTFNIIIFMIHYSKGVPIRVSELGCPLDANCLIFHSNTHNTVLDKIFSVVIWCFLYIVQAISISVWCQAHVLIWNNVQCKDMYTMYAYILWGVLYTFFEVTTQLLKIILFLLWLVVQIDGVWIHNMIGRFLLLDDLYKSILNLF
jgi:hypothetical protein